MDTYSLLREIADSWVLLAMFLFFLAIAIWAYLPSQARFREEARQIPFRNDTDMRHRSGAQDEGACQKETRNLEGHPNV